MARGPRIRERGAIHHVMSRGNRKGIIFEDDIDRRMFLALLDEALERYRLNCQSYCLMPNHYHSVVSDPEGTVSNAMQWLNGVFAHASNSRHQRVGHLWAGRFKSIMIGDDIYLRTANVYVVQNPVRAGLVSSPSDWPWSSYRASAGLAAPQVRLNLDWLLWVFGGRTLAVAQRKYREFVATPAAGTELEEALLYADEPLETAVRDRIGATLHQSRLPREYRALARPTLAELFPGPLSKGDRNALIVRAHVVHGYRMSEIADCLRVHPNTISRVVRALRLKSR